MQDEVRTLAKAMQNDAAYQAALKNISEYSPAQMPGSRDWDEHRRRV